MMSGSSMLICKNLSRRALECSGPWNTRNYEIWVSMGCCCCWWSPFLLVPHLLKDKRGKENHVNMKNQKWRQSNKLLWFVSSNEEMMLLVIICHKIFTCHIFSDDTKLFFSSWHRTNWPIKSKATTVHSDTLLCKRFTTWFSHLFITWWQPVCASVVTATILSPSHRGLVVLQLYITGMCPFITTYQLQAKRFDVLSPTALTYRKCESWGE